MMRRRRPTFLYITGMLCFFLIWNLSPVKKQSARIESPGSDISKSILSWNEKLYSTLQKDRTSKTDLQAIPEPFQSYSEKSMPWYHQWHDRLRKGRKIILLYSTWFDQHEWGGLSGHELYRRIDRCDKATNCLLTYDKSWIKEASAVVFHGRDVEEHRNGYYSARHLREVKRGLPSTQKWIFLSQENPWKDINVYKPYDGVFNWTATFNRKSNVFTPYQRYVLRVKPQNVERNYAREKTGLVAWAASNCQSKLRLDYVRRLQRHVRVTVYGKCNGCFDSKRFCKHSDPDCRKEISKYKFYLAFENDFCDDYVTEKYWKRIQQNVVPVVMGSNYDGLAIPGSFIDVSDFGSVRELAEYLLYLDKNDDAYNKYFAYKTMYKEGNEDLYCSICEMLNSKDAIEHCEVKLSEEFNYEKNCGMNRGKADALQKQRENDIKDESILLSMYARLRCWLLE